MAAAARAVVERTLADGIEAYGVTTGVGVRKSFRVTADGHEALLLRQHLIAQGPALPRDVVRAAALRLANALAQGLSAARPELAERVVRALNDDDLPGGAVARLDRAGGSRADRRPRRGPPRGRGARAGRGHRAAEPERVLHRPRRPRGPRRAEAARRARRCRGARPRGARREPRGAAPPGARVRPAVSRPRGDARPAPRAARRQRRQCALAPGPAQLPHASRSSTERRATPSASSSSRSSGS